jgi:D-serine deaminase-like pyridoxal phosphate-dependent protein
VNRDALEQLRNDPIDWRYKGFSPGSDGVTPANVREQEWNLLAGDLPTPVLVLKESALEHNLELMARWCSERGVSLAPHGKTTMSPELYERQLALGAWGITAANIAQVRVYRAFGIERVLLANELVEPAALRWVAAEVAADPGFDFYCLADSVEAVERMTQALRSPVRPLQVLVELGLSGGRTGARTLEQAERVAAAAGDSPALELSGVEGYEGILHGENALDEVDDFLDELRLLVSRMDFDGREEIIVTAGGSAYFDHVAERLAAAPARLVLRSGCYVTHDSGFYEHFSPLGGRGPAGADRLRPALEAWGAVLSRPEPELALLLMGKRDVPYDIDLPSPFAVRGPDGLRDVTGMQVTELNDQHAFLRLPADDPLAVGDLVGCGISHPCTAFDKWRLIPVVDDDYTVVDAVHTFF